VSSSRESCLPCRHRSPPEHRRPLEHWSPPERRARDEVHDVSSAASSSSSPAVESAARRWGGQRCYAAVALWRPSGFERSPRASTRS
jgi:hypothetical protein